MRLTLLLLCCTLFLSACASTFSPFPKTEEHIVGAGDTVYSVAFENDLDYRDLARWNDISPPYKIYRGQMLVLHSYHPLAKNGDNQQPQANSKPEKRVSKIKTRPIAPADASAMRKVESKPVVAPAESKPLPPPVIMLPAPVSSPQPKPEPKSEPKPAVVAKAAKPAAVPVEKKWTIPKYDSAWIWPVRGAILDKYSATNKGIDIAGKAGEPVRSTAAGKVVYAGEGLKGYGLLLIVKHDQDYLSAYGHNDRLLVVQGETVIQGQPIATLGRGPENRAMLHFELRKNGKPVNPQGLLPK